MAKVNKSIEDIMNGVDTSDEELENSNEELENSNEEPEKSNENSNEELDDCPECGSTDLVTRESGLVICNTCHYMDRSKYESN